MLPQPICTPQGSPMHSAHHPSQTSSSRVPLSSSCFFDFLAPLDSGISIPQVMKKGGVKIPLVFPSSPCFLKQTVSRQLAAELCLLGSSSFCSCTKDLLQDQHLSAMALMDLATESYSYVLVLDHLSRSSPQVLSQSSCHKRQGRPWCCGVAAPFSQRKRLRENNTLASLYAFATRTDTAFLKILGVSRHLATFCSPVLDTGPCLHIEMNHLPQETSRAGVLPLYRYQIPLLHKCLPAEGPVGSGAG